MRRCCNRVNISVVAGFGTIRGRCYASGTIKKELKKMRPVLFAVGFGLLLAGALFAGAARAKIAVGHNRGVPVQALKAADHAEAGPMQGKPQ
jgi:hypothetical protein